MRGSTRILAKLFVLAASLAAGAAFGGETGYATRDLELRAEPVAGSPVVGTLAKGARFEIAAEKGAWASVASGAVKGWTLSFYVMKGEPPAQVSAGTRLGEVWSLGTERRSETVAVIGVRGLDEEQLKSAHFNEAELKRAESFAEGRAAAEAFARRAGLAPRPQPYLAEPAAPAAAAPAQQ